MRRVQPAAAARHPADPLADRNRALGLRAFGARPPRLQQPGDAQALHHVGRRRGVLHAAGLHGRNQGREHRSYPDRGVEAAEPPHWRPRSEAPPAHARRRGGHRGLQPGTQDIQRRDPRGHPDLRSPDIRVLLRPGHEPALRGEAARRRLPPALSGDGLRPGALVMPAPVNAHDHGYGVRTLDFGGLDDALETWIPLLRLRPRTDPYLEALVAFSRLALTGVGATMHCHNSLNVDRLVEEAAAAIRAAADVGVRLALSCPLLDFDPWAYGGGPDRLRPFLAPEAWPDLAQTIPRYAPIARQIEAVDQIAADNAGPMVDVQFGP